MNTTPMKKSKNSASANRFVRMPEHLMNWLDKEHQLKPYVVRPLKAGTMLLWDSRTIHCNAQTMAEERMVVYTCQTPRAWAKAAKGNQLDRMKGSFRSGRNTSHWPHFHKVFPTRPHTYGQELRKFAPTMSDEDLVAERHLKAFDLLLADQSAEERLRMVRLAGFESLADYACVKEVPLKKRKASSDGQRKAKKTKIKH